MTELSEKRTNFIRQIIEDDLASAKHTKIITRFPPEPNGYLHVGHAKSICLNFGLAQDYHGECNLRFDDTNPIKEEDEFVNAIKEDVEWLGFTWTNLCHASDYYPQLYDFAVDLINSGKAYVDSLTMDEIRAYRGTLTEPGKNSPYRDRSIAENLELFEAMKAGKFPDGTHVLRAKIDMSSGNINMRDPILYRIRHVSHQRTGDEWCIYPMYDYAHPISDALEKITHSLCTLEFQDHRPLYDWLINNLSVPAKPIQTEFARLNLSHTVTSKRKLRELVESNVVDGWDDPRMPTIKGMRHRGYPPKALHTFCEMIGISKADSVIDMSLLEACVREELNYTAPRAMAVFEPLKIEIENLDEDMKLSAKYFPQNPDSTVRELPFTKTLYIERSDFMENPPKDYHRLSVGKEVRLRHAYILKCEAANYDDQGNLVSLRCTIDKDTLGKNPQDRKVKGVIHWVSASASKPMDIIQYDRLFNHENPGSFDDYLSLVNPESKVITQAWVEPAIVASKQDDVFQFERIGYFKVNQCTGNGVSAFHRIVGLKDGWGKNA